ncbi:carboxymuconolactone decarboxylase family protein [Rhodoferax sediminis]|uniref:Carboxymuconolactone decarboxylase family protein n=2 Tax=Rhodoferax sediminis TaxID=2509614 RepID=A0A515DDZ4_9BURK|nr:carboxymuconolactone decarboxylase family protein [Rhodoferax sediminis]
MSSARTHRRAACLRGTPAQLLHGVPIDRHSKLRSNQMTLTSTSDSARVYKNVPQLARIREQVLLGDVWKQPELAYRDRILVTLGVLAAGGKLDEMKVWMRRGVENGITLDELRGLVVQVTFYAGWPAGLAAGKAALELFEVEAK